MKIAVLGCGAVGSFYGAKLAAAGQELHFLLRSDYEVVRRAGVRIESREGNFCVRPHCARQPEQIGACDLVLIGLKTTANGELRRLLPPLRRSGTAVLTLQNGLGNEEFLAELCGPENVMGGLCFVCLNRVEPGLIQHIAQGQIALGEFQRPPQPRTIELARIFRGAGVPCELRNNLECAHWEKLMWNIPFNGLGVASAAGYASVCSGRLSAPAALETCLTTDRLLSAPPWAELVRALMREVRDTAGALGFSIPEDLAEDLISRTRSMGAYKSSTAIDFERGQPLELESLFLRPLRYARAAKVETPRLAALCEILKALDAVERARA